MTGSRRILHIADPGWPGGGPTTLRLLADASTRLTHDEHIVIVLGNRDALRAARRCGVRAVGHVAIPGGWGPFARRALARAVASLIDEHGDIAIVHAWSTRAALLVDACPKAAPVVSCAVAPIDGLHSEFLGARLASRPMPILATSTSVRQELVARGIPADLVRVLPAGVDVGAADGAPDGARRTALRHRWGVDDSTFVLGLLGDPIEWTDARAAVFMLTLLRVAGHPAHLIMHPKARRAAQMAQWGGAISIDRHVCLDEEVAMPWSVAPGLDVALHFGDETTAVNPRPLGSVLSVLLGGGRPARPMSGVLPLLWSAAAAVPTLAESSLAACGVIEEGVSGLLVEPRHVDAAARRLLTLAEDPQLRRRLGNSAREHVAEHCSRSAMLVRLRQVYDALAANQPLPASLDAAGPDDQVGALKWSPRAETAHRRHRRVE